MASCVAPKQTFYEDLTGDAPEVEQQSIGEKDFTKKNSSTKRSRSDSSSSQSPKKQKLTSDGCKIYCPRIHFVKVFQNFSTFLELYDRGHVKVENCPDARGLLSYLDALCHSIQEQAFLTCHRTLTETQIQRFVEIK